MKHNRNAIWTIGVAVLLSLAACGGKGGGGPEGGGEDWGGPGDDGGGGPGGPGGSNSPADISFNVSGATALIATESSSAMSGLLPLTISSFRPDGDGTAAGGDGSTTDGGGETGDEEAGSNLMTVDEDGNVAPAMDTNVPVKVAYSVADPTGTYVYIVLDTGWSSHGGGGGDYTRAIAEENCAFFRVSLADNTRTCVMQGTLIQSMNDEYMKNISGNQKPVQFDAAGNVYFSGTHFERETNTWEGCCDENGESYQVTEYWINQVQWANQIFRADAETGEIDQLTQDNTYVDFFLALSTGEVAYQQHDTDTWESSLNMWKTNGSTVQLSDANWGVNFFTSDSANTIVWGTWDWQNPGMYFATPRAAGGVYKTKLSTELFGADRNGNAPTMRRAIVGDNGNLYGVFESWIWDQSANDGDGESLQRLSVYQILPFDGIPKVQLDLPTTSGGWWDWFGRTPFQVAQGYLYYTASEEVPYEGDRDVIRMVNLDDRSVTTLLGDEGARYDLYNWRLSNGTLFFSGQDLTTTTVVTGEIDTAGVASNPDDPANMSVSDAASATASFEAIQDIEVLRPTTEVVDVAAPPTVTYRTNAENLYSASLEFSQYMDKASVEDAIAFMDGATEIECMKVWIDTKLHLIPDTSAVSAALGDSEGDGLDAGTDYDIVLTGTVQDVFGNVLDTGAGAADHAFRTRPNSGWYDSVSQASDADVSAGDIAKFAGPDRTNPWDWVTEAYRITGYTGLENFRLEFSAQNLSWAGVNVLLFNPSRCWGGSSGGFCINSYDSWDAQELFAEMGGWTNLNYRSQLDGSQWDRYWDNGSTPELFNGQWQSYRLDFYGTNFVVSVSTDGTTYNEVETISQDDVEDRTGSGDAYSLYLVVREPLALDNLRIVELTTGGVETGADVVNEDFTGEDTAAYFGADRASSLGY